MAMPSVRLPASVFRKPDAWLRLWATLRGARCPHAPRAPSNRHFYFSSPQSGAWNCKTLLHRVLSLRLPGLFAPPESTSPLSRRLKSGLSSKKSPEKTLQKVEAEEDSDEDEAHELRAPGEELDDDPSLPRDYKDLEKAVQSFRYDVILKTGLDVGRK